MARAFWLIKSEPSVYPWSQLVSDGRTAWEGVRNFEARNHLRAMRVGDLALYYHSNEGREVVGVAEVVKAAYPDATCDPGDDDWSAVDVAPHQPLARAVTLAQIKAEPRLADIGLIKRSRLSVTPVTRAHFDLVLELGGTKLGR